MQMNGVFISNIRSVKLVVDGPADSEGIDNRRTIAATIEVERDASEEPILDIFDVATNLDGRENILSDGETSISFVSDDHTVSYRIEVKKGFISEWGLLNPSAPSAPTIEYFTLKVGHLLYDIDGEKAEYKIETIK